MEKTITIGGREVKFKSTGATAIRYKAQFRKDFFSELLKLNALSSLKTNEKGEIDINSLSQEDIEKIDFEVFYNIAWVFAKTADPTIGDPISWLESFDEFPLSEIMPELQEMLVASMYKSKKK